MRLNFINRSFSSKHLHLVSDEDLKNLTKEFENNDIMKFIKPYTVNLSVNLEPIYAIIFALLIFKNSELMNLNFYLGSMIVVGSILINAFFKKTTKQQKVD